MNHNDWQRKIVEVIETLKTRYDHIGSKSGVPFLAVVYPSEAQESFFQEWLTHASAVKQEITIHHVNVLSITQQVISELGADNIVESIDNPLVGSDPQSELGKLWISSIVKAVNSTFDKIATPKPVVCLTHLAALYPATGPRSLMQALWGDGQGNLKGPVILFIPGTISGTRKYCFLCQQEEFMYRGDLL